MLRSRALLLGLIAFALLSAGVASAQESRAVRATRFLGSDMVELTSLARAAGVVATEAGVALTYRAAGGVVTFFADSNVALQQKPGDPATTEVALSAPVLRLMDGWWAPLDALEFLGVGPSPGDASVILPGGAATPLRYETLPTDEGRAEPAGVTADSAVGWEINELGPGVSVLRLYSGEAELTLLDLPLLPLARPDLTREVDAALDAAGAAGAARDSVLLLQVVSISDSEWNPALTFTQGDRVLEVRYPYRLLLQAGGPDVVGPGAPVAGVILLPPAFDLYRPLGVQWDGVSAEVAFRR